MYNLRARYYNPASGVFNQLDSFAGNAFDPQSLHKYAYTHCDPLNQIDPSGNTSIGEVLVVIGVILNIASLGYHLGAARNAAANGDTQEYVKNEAWAMVDFALLLVPGSGLIGPSAQAATAGVKGGYYAAKTAVNAEELLRKGVQASAVWGYVSFATIASAGGDDGVGSGGGEGANGGSGNEPGHWEPEDQSNWSAEAQAYQWQITGRSGQRYVVNGRKFDGWDPIRRVLLDASDALGERMMLLQRMRDESRVNPIDRGIENLLLDTRMHFELHADLFSEALTIFPSLRCRLSILRTQATDLLMILTQQIGGSIFRCFPAERALHIHLDSTSAGA